MVKEGIYKLDRVLDRDIERRILEIFPDDQGDVRRFTNDFLAQGYSSGPQIAYRAWKTGITKFRKIRTTKALFIRVERRQDQRAENLYRWQDRCSRRKMPTKETEKG